MAGRRLQRTHRGAALLIFLVLLVMGGLTYVVNSFSPESIEARRAQKTQEALVTARDALIGYSLQHREQKAAQSPPVLDAMYGYLPLPDFGESFNRNADFSHPCATEGCAKMNATGLSGNGVLVGRFPWKTVGTGPLRDGHGECLWYAVSASHRAINSSATMMNWDTLAAPVILIGSSMPDLNSLNAHDRPIAVIFSPGPAFDSGRTASADAPECGGNYDSSHYVNPALNNSQRALPIQSNKLFDHLRKASTRQPGDTAGRPPGFADDINDMIGQIVLCARDQIAANTITANGKVNDTCSLALNSFGPMGYYSHYRDQVFVTRCSSCAVTVDGAPQASCAGALLFGNQRAATQNRRDSAEKSAAASYLENHKTTDPPEGNLESYTTGGGIYWGPSLLGPVKASRSNPGDIARCAPGGAYWSADPACQTIDQDIVRCIPSGPSQITVSLDLSARFAGVTSLANYAAGTQLLTLGASGVQLTSTDPDAGKLFACSWSADAHDRGSGFRSYFRFKILNTGDGFTFAIIDADRNSGIHNRCGAARQHLGYSGNNGYTLPLEYPKLAIEFDTSRNYSSTGISGYNEAGSTLTNGRNDPDYTPPYDNDSHVAVMYWGYEAANAGAGVSQPAQDDNVHGFPLSDDPPARPAPRNATATLPHPFPAPYPPLAIAPVDRLRNTSMVNRDFHVRVEVTPLARSAADETLKRRNWKTEIWLEPTNAKAITALVWTSADGMVTVTAPGHNFSNGDTILIREAPTNINGDHVIHTIDQGAGTFRFTKSTDPGSIAISGQSVAMKLTDQVGRMRSINRPMALLSPVVKFNSCTSDADCAASQSCSGADLTGTRYCHSGHQPKVYDQQAIYDIDLGGGNYQDALRSIRLGFTMGIGSSDQVIDISEFHTQWIP